VQASFLMLSLDRQLFRCCFLTELWKQRRVNHLFVWPQEINISCTMIDDLKALIMHQPVMSSAQQQEIIQPGFAAVAPVVNVMGIHKARFTAARKAAGMITDLQSATQRRWNCTGLAPHIEYIAIFVLQDR